VTLLEVVVRGSLVLGTRLFEHFVENAPARGSSRLLAISASGKVIIHGFALALLILLLLLLPVASLGALVGALEFLILALPLILVTTKNGTDCLLAGSVVGDNVHQFIGSDGGVAA
jgi:hypothetical protein